LHELKALKSISYYIVETFSKSVTTVTSRQFTSAKDGRIVVPVQNRKRNEQSLVPGNLRLLHPNWIPEVTSKPSASCTS
jgi:hypothetical protein